MMRNLARTLRLVSVCTLTLQSLAPLASARQTASTALEPFRDPSVPAERRIDDLVSRLTIDEKIACLSTNPAIPRLGLRMTRIVEGIHGLAMSGPANWAHKPPIPTTTFQQGIGLGETWDPDLLERVAHAEGVEARYIFQSPTYQAGGIVVLSPNADLGRDPRWGRTEECYGEDPYFNGTMVTAFVRGLQGNDPKYWLCASLLKHFLANSNEEGRERTSSDFDERLFREYYSVPFRMGIVDGGSRAFMAAYNKVNGVPMAVSPILEDVTRTEWGEDGIISTDGGAMRLLVDGHHAYPDLTHAAAACLKAGITMFLDNYQASIRDALDKGLVSEADLDRAIRPTFRVAIKLGLLDPPASVPYTSIGSGPEPWLSPEHRALALEAARKSIVLLKNEKGTLPLDRSKLSSIAVIGPRAGEVLLDWYSGTPPYRVSVLDGVRAKLGDGVKVRYAADDTNGAAVAAAKASDVAVVVVGNHPTCDDAGWGVCKTPSDGREAVDRKSLTLEQEDLVRAVYAANPRTVVVLVSSFPYSIDWSEAHVPAILHVTHCSQEQGSAVADALVGDLNPAGRLVQTWPRTGAVLPPMLDYDIRHGRTYMYATDPPLYPFGFGLSYTSFSLAKLRTSASGLASGHSIDVSVDVTNTGKRDGEEVVQLYVEHQGSSVARPRLALAGFRRVAVRAGETRAVTIPLAASQLAYWDVATHRFVVESDRVRLRIGSSSASLPLERTIDVEGDPRPTSRLTKGTSSLHVGRLGVPDFEPSATDQIPPESADASLKKMSMFSW